ncbi:MAG: nucleoside monophosphate kinase, partial [bacterium]|nr:nucleoside monophosphate kinase [bacterium]
VNIQKDQQDLPRIVIFFGAPGSGKGTQTTLASEVFRLSRVEMSKILETRFQKALPGDMLRIEGKEYSILEQKKLWQEGSLVADEFVFHLATKRILELSERGESIILDGFPRTVAQGDLFLPFLSKTYSKDRITIIFLDIQEDEAVSRNSKRRICELARHPILSNEETKRLTLCPLDGSSLVRRSLDEPDIIRFRIQKFTDQTLPLVQYFEDHDMIVHTVLANQSVANVFQEVSDILKKQD